MARKLQDPAGVLFDSVLYLADRGFHGQTIARCTGLSRHQVYYRLHQLGMKLRDYRDGKTTAAKEYIEMSPCVQMQVVAEPKKAYPVQPYAILRKAKK